MQVEHKTEKGTILFVKVPDDAYNFTVGISKLYFKVNESSQHIKIDPSGNWQLISLTSEVTEEQANMMVETTLIYKKHGIKSYNFKSYIDGFLGFNNALDSFKSIMQHLQVYKINPYPNSATQEFKKSSTKNQNEIFLKWHSAQEITGKWVVLFKEN